MFCYIPGLALNVNCPAEGSRMHKVNRRGSQASGFRAFRTVSQPTHAENFQQKNPINQLQAFTLMHQVSEIELQTAVIFRDAHRYRDYFKSL
jgi:hypothetical protein